MASANPTADQIKQASRWGPLGFLALAVLVVAGGVAYAIAKSGAPEISVSSREHWTKHEHYEYALQVEGRVQRLEAGLADVARVVGKQDRMLERLEAIASAQTTLIQELNGRIKSLESWATGKDK